MFDRAKIKGGYNSTLAYTGTEYKRNLIVEVLAKSDSAYTEYKWNLIPLSLCIS
jgi:hypothetical protein